MMKHSVSKRKDLIIIKIEEPVFDIRHADSFYEAIDHILDSKADKNIIIDFSLVKAIDSSGISSMLLAHRKANQSELLTIFVSLCQQIKDILKLSGLDKQLYIFTSLNEVMTLIEASRNKKACSKKSRPHKTTSQNGTAESDLEMIPSPIINDDDHIIDETAAIESHSENESGGTKKRGRPKKSLSGSLNGSRAKK